jgi:hypothetical protein
MGTCRDAGQRGSRRRPEGSACAPDHRAVYRHDLRWRLPSSRSHTPYHLAWHEILADAEMLERTLCLRAPELVGGDVDLAKAVHLITNVAHEVFSPGSKSSRAVLSRLGETLRRDEAVELPRTNASYGFAFINERSEVRINIPTPATHVAWAGKERGWYVGRKDGFLGPRFHHDDACDRRPRVVGHFHFLRGNIQLDVPADWDRICLNAASQTRATASFRSAHRVAVMHANERPSQFLCHRERT